MQEYYNTPINWTGTPWYKKEFLFPERTIRIATSFSGIGAAEYAFKRLGLRHEIVFACDNGERYLKFGYAKLASIADALNPDEKNEYVQHLLKANQPKMKDLTFDSIYSGLFGGEKTSGKLELPKECIDILTEGKTQEQTTKKKGRTIIVKREGDLVGEFRSSKEASEYTGICACSIRKNLNGYQSYKCLCKDGKSYTFEYKENYIIPGTKAPARKYNRSRIVVLNQQTGEIFYFDSAEEAAKNLGFKKDVIYYRAKAVNHLVGGVEIWYENNYSKTNRL